MTKISTTLPRVNVIMPHLNDHDRLKLALQDLMAQTYPKELLTITVVDNGSEWPIDDVIAPFPSVTGLIEEVKGSGPSRNRGVTATFDEILAFTDSDCRPDPKWVEEGVNYLLEQAGEIVAGEVYVFPVDADAPNDAELFDMVFGFECERYVKHKNFAVGANIICWRRVFDDVGPFKNGNFPEDLEWGRRAVAKGHKIVYGPKSFIRHPARKTWAELEKKADRTNIHAFNHMWHSRFGKIKWVAYALAMCSPPFIKAWIVFTTDRISGIGNRFRTLFAMIKLRAYRVRGMAYLFFHPHDARPPLPTCPAAHPAPQRAQQAKPEHNRIEA